MTAIDKKQAQAELQNYSLAISNGYTLEQGADELGIRTKTKTNPIVFKRQLFWMMLKFRYGSLLTLQRLGQATGGHTHATVLKGIEQCKDSSKEREKYRAEVFEIVQKIKIS